MERVILKVFRFDPDVDKGPYFSTYQVEPREGMTVIEALLDILDKQDSSLAFRYACRGAVCGSCAMYINGSYRLACETQLSMLGNEILVCPLPHLRVIKDLVVDMSPFFEKYNEIMPYLMTETPAPQKERLQSPKQRKAVDPVIDCILCGSCYSACPMTWLDKEYLGPAALAKAYRFVADSRDENQRERLMIVDSEEGIWRCHSIFNCVEACPKKINPADSIQRLRRRVLAQKLKFW